VICPNCGRDYGSSLLRFDWCPGDRAYFCAACTRERNGCPACKSRPAGVHLGAAGLVLFMLVVVSAAAVLPQHISRSVDIGTDPVNFGNATAGKDVKLLANLKSPERTAFILLLRDGRWQLLMKAEVSVVDAKGKTIRLDLTTCHDFYPLFHNRSNSTSCEYWSGDKVTAFGRVQDDGAGNKTLEVRRLYPGEKDPYLLQSGWYQALYLIPVITLILFLQVLVFYLYRRHLHARYVAGHPVADKEVLEPGVSLNDISWRESPVPGKARKRAGRLSLAAALLFAGDGLGHADISAMRACGLLLPGVGHHSALAGRLLQKGPPPPVHPEEEPGPGGDAQVARYQPGDQGVGVLDRPG
jgi:hypothetical protein